MQLAQSHIWTILSLIDGNKIVLRQVLLCSPGWPLPHDPKYWAYALSLAEGDVRCSSEGTLSVCCCPLFFIYLPPFKRVKNTAQGPKTTWLYSSAFRRSDPKIRFQQNDVLPEVPVQKDLFPLFTLKLLRSLSSHSSLCSCAPSVLPNSLPAFLLKDHLNLIRPTR